VRCLWKDIILAQVSEIKEAERQMGLSNNIPSGVGYGSFKEAGFSWC